MTEQLQRPTLLTIALVLTFIGSVFNIYSGLSSYITADSAPLVAEKIEEIFDETMEDIDEKQLSDEQKSFFEQITAGVNESLVPANVRKLSLVKLFSGLIILIGALFMWKLREKGFFLYVLGSIFSLVGPILVLSGIALWMAIGVPILVTVIFVSVYAYHLKYMH